MKKKKLKALKKLAEVLPEEKYKYFPKYNTPIKEPSDREGDEEGFVLRTGFLDEHGVNHERRLKILLKNKDYTGINNYFNSRGFELKQK